MERERERESAIVSERVKEMFFVEWEEGEIKVLLMPDVRRFRDIDATR